MAVLDRTGYVFAASDSEHARLVRMAGLMEPHVRDTCTRLGLAPRARVIEFGCGPVGALLPLSEAVGPDGMVVGLDRSGDALAKARAILTARGVQNVRLVQADLHTFAREEVCPPGPFDLAYCRLVLCYQQDVAAALRRIASVVRPGGYIVAHEMVLTAPIPIAVPGPFVPAANVLINDWFAALLKKLGTRWDVAERFSAVCREAALAERDQRIFVTTLQPAQAGTGISVYHGILAGTRPLLLQHNIASEEAIDRVLGDLRLAQEREYTTTVFTHLQAELVAQVV